MNTRTAPHRPLRHTDTEPLRLRAQLPAVRMPRPAAPAPPAVAMHDFLVPNPRPDLVAETRGLPRCSGGL